MPKDLSKIKFKFRKAFQRAKLGLQQMDTILDNIDKIRDLLIYGGCAIVGAQVERRYGGSGLGGALTGCIALKLATAPSETAALTGLAMLGGIGLAAIQPSAKGVYEGEEMLLPPPVGPPGESVFIKEDEYVRGPFGELRRKGDYIFPPLVEIFGGQAREEEKPEDVYR